MKPSEIVVHVICPFTGTFERSEIEDAAALLVRVMAAFGDEWRSVASPEVGELARRDLAEGSKFAAYWNNPFVRPDFGGLVDRGFAAWEGEPFKSPLGFTLEGFARLSRWRVRA